MRTRRNSVLAPFGRQRLGAGIITALRLLYHLDLRLDGTARQMHAHASMACAFLAIIPYSVFFLKGKVGEAASF